MAVGRLVGLMSRQVTPYPRRQKIFVPFKKLNTLMSKSRDQIATGLVRAGVLRETGIIRGGIGDILLRVGSIKPGVDYKVVSHFRQAADLVRPYTDDFECLFMDTPVAYLKGEIEPFIYPTLKIPEQSLKKAQTNRKTAKRLVGIHPIGSELSRSVDTRKGRPLKNLPKAFMARLIDFLKAENVEPVLFCAPAEGFLYQDLGVQIVAEPYIWDCIAQVSLCDLVIAVDSAIKTISAILHKPTLVLLGDYEDARAEISSSLPIRRFPPSNSPTQFPH